MSPQVTNEAATLEHEMLQRMDELIGRDEEVAQVLAAEQVLFDRNAAIGGVIDRRLADERLVDRSSRLVSRLAGPARVAAPRRRSRVALLLAVVDGCVFTILAAALLPDLLSLFSLATGVLAATGTHFAVVEAMARLRWIRIRFPRHTASTHDDADDAVDSAVAVLAHGETLSSYRLRVGLLLTFVAVRTLLAAPALVVVLANGLAPGVIRAMIATAAAAVAVLLAPVVTAVVMLRGRVGLPAARLLSPRLGRNQAGQQRRGEPRTVDARPDRSPVSSTLVRAQATHPPNGEVDTTADPETVGRPRTSAFTDVSTESLAMLLHGIAADPDLADPLIPGHRRVAQNLTADDGGLAGRHGRGRRPHSLTRVSRRVRRACARRSTRLRGALGHALERNRDVVRGDRAVGRRPGPAPVRYRSGIRPRVGDARLSTYPAGRLSVLRERLSNPKELAYVATAALVCSVVTPLAPILAGDGEPHLLTVLTNTSASIPDRKVAPARQAAGPETASPPTPAATQTSRRVVVLLPSGGTNRTVRADEFLLANRLIVDGASEVSVVTAGYETVLADLTMPEAAQRAQRSRAVLDAVDGAVRRSTGSRPLIGRDLISDIAETAASRQPATLLVLDDGGYSFPCANVSTPPTFNFATGCTSAIRTRWTDSLRGWQAILAGPAYSTDPAVKNDAPALVNGWRQFWSAVGASNMHVPSDMQETAAKTLADADGGRQLNTANTNTPVPGTREPPPDR